MRQSAAPGSPTVQAKGRTWSTEEGNIGLNEIGVPFDARILYGGENE